MEERSIAICSWPVQTSARCSKGLNFDLDDATANCAQQQNSMRMPHSSSRASPCPCTVIRVGLEACGLIRKLHVLELPIEQITVTVSATIGVTVDENSARGARSQTEICLRLWQRIRLLPKYFRFKPKHPCIAPRKLSSTAHARMFQFKLHKLQHLGG